MSAQGTRPTVLVTGASSGIGRALADELVATGWHVFAGSRDPADHPALATQEAASAELVPLRLDVTSDEHVREARSRVDAAVGERGLDAVVHNAAVVVPGPLELLRLQLREHRERDHFPAGLLGMGEISLAIAELREALLQVQRHRVVDRVPDAARVEVFA